jgi:hypothetical protein
MFSSAYDSDPIRHGPISCQCCFPAGSVPGCTFEAAGWRADNNPGYWGAVDPEVLVLGFSKGANQRSTLPFDQVAFHNARSNLAEILNALDLIDPSADFDTCFTAAETKLGFASVVRCGLGKEVEPGKYATSGVVVRAAVAPDSEARHFFEACTDKHLRTLPPSVRVVVFLGLDGPYVEAVFERMVQLHPSIRRRSTLAYATESVTFVHVIHPSPLATSHRQIWLRDDNTSLANKRREVRLALTMGSGGDVALSQPINIERKISPTKPRKKADGSALADRKVTELVGMLADAMQSGALNAKEIPNKREGDHELRKVFRLCRADGEEFAVQLTEKEILIWSSVPPTVDTPLASPAEEYPPKKPRHSNLGCMQKLRGPKNNGADGAHAWKLHFDTSLTALRFIVSAIRSQ